MLVPIGFHRIGVVLARGAGAHLHDLADRAALHAAELHVVVGVLVVRSTAASARAVQSLVQVFECGRSSPPCRPRDARRPVAARTGRKEQSQHRHGAGKPACNAIQGVPSPFPYSRRCCQSDAEHCQKFLDGDVAACNGPCQQGGCVALSRCRAERARREDGWRAAIMRSTRNGCATLRSFGPKPPRPSIGSSRRKRSSTRRPASTAAGSRMPRSTPASTASIVTCATGAANKPRSSTTRRSSPSRRR